MVKQIIDKHGSSSIALKMSESLQAVNNWKSRGVPLDKVVQFCEAVNFEITPHQIYPKNYPHPEDGLPDHLRSAA